MAEYWERQPGEPSRAYALARIYFELGPSRSLAKVRDAFDEDDRPFDSIRKLAVEYNWNPRAESYDDYVNTIRKQAVESAIAERNLDWAREREDQRLRELEIGKLAFHRAKILLQREPSRWNLGDVARLIDVATKVLRLATELETERKEVNVNVQREAEELASQLGLHASDLIAEAEKILSKAQEKK